MIKLTIQNIISRQLRRPGGIGGNIVAGLMAAGNKQMYNYVLSQSGKLGKNVLEIGFGGGTHFKLLLDHTNNGTAAGIDISESMVKLARRKNKKIIADKRLILKQADSSDIPWEDSEFDTVLSLNTIYFWRNPLSDLDQILRVLKPGGRLLLGINSKELMIKNGYKKKYFNFFEKTDIDGLLSKAGFKDIEHSYQVLRIEDCHLFIAKKK